MTGKKTIKIPASLLVLDFVGTILFTVGIVDLVSDFDLVPINFQFSNYEIIFIVIGLFFILHFMYYLIKAAFGKLPREI